LAEAKEPQEVGAAGGVLGAGNSAAAADVAVATRMLRKGESLSDYMADAPIVADVPDGLVLEG
jgi:hypothetical protein